MSLYGIGGTIWLLFWYLSGFFALKVLEDHPEVQKSRALPYLDLAALLCGPLVLLALVLYRFFHAPLHTILERLRLEDGIRMTFRRNGETIPEDKLEHAAPRAIRRIFKSALDRAAALHASDLLSEPLPSGGAVLRIKSDGALRTLRKLSAEDAQALLTLTGFLVGNGLELSPVGESTLEFQGPHGRSLLRIGMLKVSGGTRLSFHLLQPERPIATTADLGMDQEESRAIRQFLALRNGLIVIAGDRGSGRSLTLERILDLADLGSRSAILISRATPVKLRPEVMWLDAGGENAASNVTLAALQQSPDLLAVDDVNDRDSLAALLTAARSSLLAIVVLRSGKLAETMQRLAALGAAPAQLAEALRLVIQIHPLRRLCSCARAYTPSSEESAFLNAVQLPLDKLRAAAGCPQCGSTGYRGTTAAFELYTPGETLRGLLTAGKPLAPGPIRNALESELGNASVYTAGCRAAALGLTSLEEVAALQNAQQEPEV